MENTGAISIDLSSEDIKSMCVGCLSIDRKLHLINEECKQMYYGFLDLSDNGQKMALCFECSAMLQRVVCFKRQVKHAHTQLFTTIHSHKPKSLSKLNMRKTVHIDNSEATYTAEDPHNAVLFSKYTTDNIQNENCNDRNGSNQKLNIKSRASKRKHEKSSADDEISRINNDNSSKKDEEYTEPLAFVKMEDPDFDGVETDEVKAQMTTEFVDSDDEPLKVKSQKHKEKTRRGRRKKEKNARNLPKGGKDKEQWGVVSDPRVARKLRDLNVASGHIALVLLTWEEVSEERRCALQSAAFTRHAHRCDACAIGFNHKHKLQDHMRKHAEDAGGEICDICTIRCKTRAALSAHRRRHRARWVCQWCGARYSQACVAADHCARAHALPAPTHRCPHCDHTAPSLGKLRMHIKSHSSRPECALCGKSFRDKSSLRTHAFVHRGEKEHACSVCSKTFMFKKQKEIHELTHMDHQNLYCLQCDVTFKNQTSYYQHLKYNLKHIDPADIKHACTVCDKRFVKAKRLEEHNLAVHLKLAPIKCTAPDCTFACASRAALRSHARLAHRPPRAPAHVCHLCGHTYKSKKSLEGHLRSHSNTRRQQTNPIPIVAPT